MAESKARLLSGILDNTGDIKSTSLDNVSTGLTLYATLDDLPTSGLTSGQQAFVTSANRVYVSNGSGWYSVALFNATPRLTISPSGAVTLAVDGSTPTVITLTGTDSDNADANLVYSVESDGSFSNIATLSQDSSVFTITPLAEGVATPGSSTLTFKVSDGISFGSGTTEFSLTFGPDWSSSTETILRASDAAANDNFGEHVSMNSDGTYLIVGAGGDGSSSGSAYVFTRSGSTWTQQDKITASDAAASDNFGTSVSMNSDGTYVLVGASGDDDNGLQSGSAYVFTRSGSTWTQQQKLTASDGQENDSFAFIDGASISGDGTYALIGARNEDGGAGDPLGNSGAVYVFTRSGSTWTEQTILRASDAGSSDFFGTSVSVDSNAINAIVGAYGDDDGASAAGAVYFFTRSGSTWTQQQKLTASDADASDNLGFKVAMSSDGTYAIAAATSDDEGASNSGAAYIFTRSGSTWSQQAKLIPSDAEADDLIGISVSINSDGTSATIGARQEDGDPNNPIDRSGSTYLFTRSGSTWTQQAKITASDAQAIDFFGSSSSISGDGLYLAVGAYNEDGGAGDPKDKAGAAYVYEAG